MYFTGELADMTPRLRTLFTGVAHRSLSPTGADAPPEIAVSAPAHVATLLDTFGPGLTVFGPTALARELGDDTAVVVVDVEGDLAEMDEVYLCSDHADGPVSVRVQDYSSSPYVSILGSTVVRVTTDSEFEEFLDDADTAYETGRFAEFLTSPAVALADMTALGYPLGPTTDGPRVRLSIAPDGDISVSPFGSSLGVIDEFSLARLDAAWSGGADGRGGAAIPLATVVDSGLRERGIAERAWLGRYLCAVEAIRSIRSHGHDDVRVSGFGSRLRGGVASDADRTRGDLPILAHTADHAFVWQDGQSLRVSREAGELLEELLTQPGSATTADADSPAGRLIGALSSVGIRFPGDTQSPDNTQSPIGAGAASR